jgi:hypothetical protein
LGWGCFEFGREVAVTWEGVDEGDIAVEGLKCAALVVKLCSLTWSSVLIVGNGFGRSVETVLLSAQSLVFGDCDVACAAKSICWCSVVGWCEWDSAFLGQVWVQ